jgi:hypothetical protein
MKNLWVFVPLPVMLWAAFHVQDYPHGPVHRGYVALMFLALGAWVVILAAASARYRGNRSGW